MEIPSYQIGTVASSGTQAEVKSTNISVNEAIFELAINSRMAFFFTLWNRDVKICVVGDITEG
jgi:hypothetical protein